MRRWFWPAASTLIQPKCLMKENEAHSFPSGWNQAQSRDGVTTQWQCHNLWASTEVEQKGHSGWYKSLIYNKMKYFFPFFSPHCCAFWNSTPPPEFFISLQFGIILKNCPFPCADILAKLQLFHTGSQIGRNHTGSSNRPSSPVLFSLLTLFRGFWICKLQLDGSMWSEKPEFGTY